jgi:hypothetical protein
MKLAKYAILAAIALSAVGCAPKLFMVGEQMVGDHYVRKMIRPVGTEDDVQITNYHMEICDIDQKGVAQKCNTTLVLENITNYQMKR